MRAMLAREHSRIARAAGQICLCLASGRGLTRRAMLEWASMLRHAADELERAAG